MSSTTTRFTRTPLMLVHREAQRRHDVYGTIGDDIALQGQLLRGEAPSKTLLLGTHPVGAPSYLPMFTALAKAGHHVLTAANRYTSGDYSLIVEKVLADLGAFVRHARDELGYEQVVLIGWSGGAALATTYQAQAERPTITQTPDGEPYDLSGLVPADGVLLLAAHRSRHHLLTEWLDPSVVDEQAPDKRDAKLDLFDPDNPSQPPYSDAFLAEYRAAQVARNRKITAWVQERLEGLRAAGRPDDELGFVVHGTMADPRWMDPAVDPNDRIPHHSYLGDPQVANNAPSGLARYCSLRSWLSQWSLDLAQADAVASAATVSVPFLILENSADDACPPSHIRAVYEAIGHDDKTFVTIQGADHYFSGPERRQQLATASAAATTWLDGHGFEVPG